MWFVWYMYILELEMWLYLLDIEVRYVFVKLFYVNIEMIVLFYKKVGCVYRIFILFVIWCFFKVK